MPAAKTGSGKTLSFIIPCFESLYRTYWSPMDGLGALVISPTRELAIQIFEVVRKVGKHHDVSCGLVIGGKDISGEKPAIGRMGILVGTPGRVLQHLEETPGFHCDNLSMLVLDEADRLLDLGFEDTLNSIISYLPPKEQRQTLLFSATQTKSVRSLARLSLEAPEFLAAHDDSKFATPQKLKQSYIVVPLQSKLDTIWSFIKTHLKSKTIIFLSTCKRWRLCIPA